jgi:hypothetical protein
MKKFILMLLISFNHCYFHHLKYIDLKDETDVNWKEVKFEDKNSKSKPKKKQNN